MSKQHFLGTGSQLKTSLHFYNNYNNKNNIIKPIPVYEPCLEYFVLILHSASPSSRSIRQSS